MNVMHVVLSLDCGGLEHLVVQLARQLQENGVKSEVACLDKKGKLGQLAAQSGIEVFELGKKNGLDFGLAWELSRLIRTRKTDLVHTHNFGPLIYGSVAARLAGKRCINTRHGRTDKQVPAWIWRLNSFVVCVSQDTKNHLLEYNRIPAEKMRVIYNGILPEGFRRKLNTEEKQSLKRKLCLREDSFVIGTTGRLAKEKDQATLLKASSQIAQRATNVELVLAGDGPLRPELEKLAQELGLGDHVKFLGYRNDIAQLLNIFDVYALSSIREGLSLSILEAMAAGLPVVATEVGGNPEVVIEGKTGYLVPCASAEKLGSAIMKLYNDRPLAQAMGEAGRKAIHEKFDLDHMASQYERLYKEALKIT